LFIEKFIQDAQKDVDIEFGVIKSFKKSDIISGVG